MIIYPTPVTSYSNFKTLFSTFVSKHDALVVYVTDSTGTQVSRIAALFANTDNLRLEINGISGLDVSVFLADFPDATHVGDIGVGI